MMLHKIKFTPLLASILFVVGMTLATATLAQNDQKSTALLNKVAKKYKAYKTMKATFSVTSETADKKKTVEEGTVYVKSSMFRLDFGGQEIFCDGKTIWTYIKDANEVTIEKYKEDSKNINPQDIFTFYQKGFKSKYAGSTARNGKTYEQVKLYPKELNKPYFQIELEIEKTANSIDKMTISKKNGSKDIFSIKTFQANNTYEDSYFRFDPKSKPGCTVNDMRRLLGMH